jgi:hypothetical protein
MAHNISLKFSPETGLWVSPDSAVNQTKKGARGLVKNSISVDEVAFLLKIIRFDSAEHCKSGL